MTAVLTRATTARASARARVRRHPLVARFVVDGRWRRTLVGVTVALVVSVAYETVVVAFMHDRRQEALVAQFQAPPTSSELRFGDAVAVLQIPDLGLNTIVAEGESHATLRAGPAHRSSSVLPGSSGNAVIAGKGYRYGAPFARLAELEPGSEVFVKLRASDPMRYIVDEVVEVPSDDADAFASGGDATLTLVTSSSRFGGDQVVVRATAAPGMLLLESPQPARPKTDDVSFTDLAVVAVWLAACVLLVVVGRRAPVALRRGAGVIVLAPIATLAALQLLLSVERLLPATV